MIKDERLHDNHIIDITVSISNGRGAHIITPGAVHDKLVLIGARRERNVSRIDALFVYHFNVRAPVIESSFEHNGGLSGILPLKQHVGVFRGRGGLTGAGGIEIALDTLVNGGSDIANGERFGFYGIMLDGRLRINEWLGGRRWDLKSLCDGAGRLVDGNGIVGDGV